MLDLVLTQFVLLWAVIDPFGSIPVYLSQTVGLSKKQQHMVAIKAVFISTMTLLFFLVFGQILLEEMQVPLPAFQAAGGLVLLLFALTMIFGESKPEQEMKLGEVDLWSQAVFPLAIPSIASPGAILAIVMLTDNSRYAISQQAVTAGIMLLVLLCTLGLLWLARPIQRVIGNAGAALISRIMGLVLAAVAMSSLLEGIYRFFIEIHQAAG
ncbi:MULTISPECIES: MarC family protein [Aliagarivorans]|uniref:MarC family protein n=1 Tax=Aliagarivorans TaxID=882379 RepID=UPI000410EB5F|nr:MULTISPECIES: MarC family protein [Aliagarivorans]